VSVLVVHVALIPYHYLSFLHVLLSLVINLSFVNVVVLKIFYPDLIDKTKTPQYILVSITQLQMIYCYFSNMLMKLTQYLSSVTTACVCLYACVLCL